MGLREQLNENPKLAVAVTAAIILLAIAAMAWYLWPASPPPPVTQGFYTIDDGKSYFADDLNRYPPYTHNGKEAVKAHVFKTENGKPFVGYLEKYSPQAKQLVDAFYKDPANKGKPFVETWQLHSERMVKKAGGGQWVHAGRDWQIAQQIQTVKDPANPSALPIEIMPGEE